MPTVRFATMLALVLGFAACSGGGDDASSDAIDATLDAAIDSAIDTATDPVTDAVEAIDAGCTEGATRCRDDGVTLATCTAGAWHETSCLATEGRLCDPAVNACVLRWRYGSPVFGACEGETRGTPETLAEKAAHYDAIATRLHLHPDLKWVMNVTLKPEATEATATWADVQQWHSGENDGLWSGLYFTSQAFRYAVTREPAVLATLKLLLAGEVDRMRITGVPGIFTRQLIPPGVPGLACPADDAAYVADVEKDDNRWVKIGDEGCVWYIPSDPGATWTKSDHCGLDAYKGWCFLDNVSQDEYAGHMMALAALYRLVDDPEVQATVKQMIEDVAVHMMEHDLTLVDWDGRVTEHGKFYLTSFADTPGFLAAEVIAFLRMGIEVSGRQDLVDFLEGCVLQQSQMGKCLSWPTEQGKSYADSLGLQLHYMGVGPGCKANYNNFAMVMTYFFDLFWFERDPAVLEKAWDAFDTQLVRYDSPRALIGQQNAWFNVIWAAMKKLGPGSDGPAYDAIDAAVCSLKQFPASKHQQAHDSAALYPHFCDGRFDKVDDDVHDDSKTEFPVPVADRCVRTFLWWADPFDRDTCGDDPRSLDQPGDYLLAYWMGRYFGFLPADL